MSDYPSCPEFGEVRAADVSQRTLEAFYRKLREDNVRAEGVTINEYAGGIVRAAVAVGWLLDLTAADIENMPPRKVMWLFAWIDRRLKSFYTIDPNWYGLPSRAPETAGGSPPKN
jgi:hypothetical protein